MTCPSLATLARGFRAAVTAAAPTQCDLHSPSGASGPGLRAVLEGSAGQRWWSGGMGGGMRCLHGRVDSLWIALSSSFWVARWRLAFEIGDRQLSLLAAVAPSLPPPPTPFILLSALCAVV